MTARRLILAALGIVTATVALVAGPRQAARTRSDRPPVVIVTGATTVPSAPDPVAVSREFVDAYAGFIYGRIPAAGLPGVSPYLRRRLAAQRPDPPAAVAAAAAPRLRSLRIATRGLTAARAVAVIADGAAAYELRLALRRVHGQWTINGLSEAG